VTVTFAFFASAHLFVAFLIEGKLERIAKALEEQNRRKP
jgi:hypothetical protein